MPHHAILVIYLGQCMLDVKYLGRVVIMRQFLTILLFHQRKHILELI